MRYVRFEMIWGPRFGIGDKVRISHIPDREYVVDDLKKCDSGSPYMYSLRNPNNGSFRPYIYNYYESELEEVAE